MVEFKFEDNIQSSDFQEDDIFIDSLNDYLNNYDIIYDFLDKNIVPKYSLKSCQMFLNHEDDDFEVSYVFKTFENISSKELSDLSLKINTDLFLFCEDKDIGYYYEKTLIVVSR